MSRMTALFGDISNIISLAITPAFLLLGVFMHMRILNNRLNRINDRTEFLHALQMSPQGMSKNYHHELSVLQRRMNVIHKANLFAASCVVIVCSVVIALLIDDVFQLRLDTLIAFLFVFSMLLLIASFSLFLHEIFIASHSLPATAVHRQRQFENVS